MKIRNQLHLLSQFACATITAHAARIPVDVGYTATPSATNPNYEDTGGIELTDGIRETAVWPAPAAALPLVGWEFSDAEVTCNFSSEVNINSVVAWFADSDGNAGVGLPESIRLTTPGGFDQTFPVTNPDGNGTTVPITIEGLDLTTESITLSIARNTGTDNTQCCGGSYEWFMMSEVEFFTPADPDAPDAIVPTEVDLVILREPAISSGQFTLENSLDVSTDLLIESITFTGIDSDRLALTEFPSSLAPGASGEVLFTIDTRGETGTFTAVATIISNDTRSPQTVQIKIISREPDPSPTTAYQRAVVESGAILYWTFDEADDEGNASSLVDNQVVNELVAQVGATRIDSTSTNGGVSLGRAASFDGGPESRFLAENLARTSPLDSFAVEFWFQSDTTAERYISEMFNESGAPNQPGLIYNYNAGQFEIFNGSRTGAMVSPDLWHHVVVAHYGPEGGVEIYLNNELQTTLTDTYAGTHSFGRFAIGNTVQNDGGLVGAIDEYAIYDLGSAGDLEAKQAKVTEIAAHSLISSQLQIMTIGLESEEMIRLVWNSQHGGVYSVNWSQDLDSFDDEISDEIASQGDLTEFIFKNPTVTTENPGGSRSLFFRVSANGSDPN